MTSPKTSGPIQAAPEHNTRRASHLRLAAALGEATPQAMPDQRPRPPAVTGELRDRSTTAG